MARFEQLHVHVQTDVGVKRDHNEDAIGLVDSAILEDELVVVVADGMGGEAAGEVASGKLVDAFRERLVNHDRSDRHDAMASLVEETNEEIVDMADSNPEMQGMGSTLVALSIARDGNARFVHVGDSRLYMFKDGNLERLTRDHSRVQLFVDEGILSPDEAEEHPESNVLTQAVGRREMTVDKNDRRAVPWADATFLVCSDGLTAMVPESVIQLAMAGLSVEEATDALIEECNRLGATDNVSIGLVRDGEPERPISRPEFHEHVPALIQQYEVMKSERKRKREQRIAEQERAAAQAAEDRKSSADEPPANPEDEEGSGHLLWILIALAILCAVLAAFLIGRSAGENARTESAPRSSDAARVDENELRGDVSEHREPTDPSSLEPTAAPVREHAGASVGTAIDRASEVSDGEAESAASRHNGGDGAAATVRENRESPANSNQTRSPERLNESGAKERADELTPSSSSSKPREQREPTGLAPSNSGANELPDGPGREREGSESLEPKPKR